MTSHRWTYPPATDSVSATTGYAHRQLLAGSEIALRNRLAVVRGYSQLLTRIARKPGVDSDRVVAFGASLAAETEQLAALLEQYFSAARLQWDSAAIAWHAVDLGYLAEQVATRFDGSSPATAGRRVSIGAVVDVQGIWDVRWLEEALAALIANALSYSPEWSQVHVRVGRQNGHARVSVRDDGYGIDIDEENRIFEPFQRGAAGREHGGAGSGLGLFIAGRAVVAHGGWIEIESELGRGSRFTVNLPLVPASPRLSA